MPYKKVFDKMKEVRQHLLTLTNYTVNKNCLFLHIDTNKITPFKKSLAPEHQWFANQLIFKK